MFSAAPTRPRAFENPYPRLWSANLSPRVFRLALLVLQLSKSSPLPTPAVPLTQVPWSPPRLELVEKSFFSSRVPAVSKLRDGPPPSRFGLSGNLLIGLFLSCLKIPFGPRPP